MEQQQSQEIYYGDRGDGFKDMIRQVLLQGTPRLKKKYIDVLTNEESMKLYSIAFTHASADNSQGGTENYDFLETRGDAIANTAIVEYMCDRHPQINCAAGVKVLARLKIVYVSKMTFAPIAEQEGFWPYISGSEEWRNTKKKKSLTDVLESFIAATSILIDRNFMKGIGYAICQGIIKNWYDKIDISLRYEDLYDNKTRLKELFDFYASKDQKVDGKAKLRSLKYIAQKNENERIQYVTAYGEILDQYGRYVRKEVGHGSAALKADAEQRAAGIALEGLRHKGYWKQLPPEYEIFARGERYIKKSV